MCCIYFGILTLQISSVTLCTRFDFTKFYILRTQCMSVFCMDNNKTPLFFLYSFNLFYTEHECVYCAVRTKSLKVIQVNLILQMGAPWRWPLTSEARFQSWPCQSEVCSRQWQRNRLTPKTSVFFPLSVPLNRRSTLIFRLALLLSYRQAAEAWKPCNKTLFFRIHGDNWKEKQFHFDLVLKG
jgi:hypothetical protein